MEDVNHDIGIIRDNPLAERIAIHGGRLHAFLFELILNLTGDRLQMRLGGAGTDQKKIGETGDAAQVDGDDVFGFFFRGEVSAAAGE